MDHELEKTVVKTEHEPQYDAAAKELLGSPFVIGQILVAVIEDFKDMDPLEAAKYIEGEPVIAKVPIDPGATNKKTSGSKKMELNTEDNVYKEGFIRFDVIFYVNTPSGGAQVIINLEAQKEEPEKYDIINRATFYVARMVPSQKGRDFLNSNYNDIKRVYSIWVVMNLEQEDLCTIQMQRNHLKGNHEWKGDEKIFNIVLIGLPKIPLARDGEHNIHHFLSRMFSDELGTEDKLELMRDYSLHSSTDMEQEVATMCNLSEAILEKGLIVGREEGREEKTRSIILNMHKKGADNDMIADFTMATPEYVEQVLKDEKATLV